MKDFIDNIPNEVSGTPINRANLMASQGFQIGTSNIAKTSDGYVETNADGHTLSTVFNSDGTITQVFTGSVIGSSTLILTKTITIGNGAITEVVA